MGLLCVFEVTLGLFRKLSAAHAARPDIYQSNLPARQLENLWGHNYGKQPSLENSPKTSGNKKCNNNCLLCRSRLQVISKHTEQILVLFWIRERKGIEGRERNEKGCPGMTQENISITKLSFFFAQVTLVWTRIQTGDLLALRWPY